MLKMKLFKRCFNIVKVILFLAVVCTLYSGVFQYLQQQLIIFPRKLLSSTRILHPSDRGWRQVGHNDAELSNNSDFSDHRKTHSPSIVDSLSLYEDDNYSFAQNEHSKSSFTTARKLPTYPEKILKILDFNHRKCCPLDYSFSSCEYSACEFTKDPAQAHLVLINGARLKNYPLPPRYPGQIWLMYTKEPPTFNRFRHLDRQDLRNQINWTRCIYRDSTFRGHYGSLESRTAPDKDYDKIYAKKKYQVAWFVSNCDSQSKRNEYVKRMSSEISIDIFGGCGNKSCGRHGLQLGLLGNKDGCLDMVSSDYKFYLSFENSLCSDYVTEKFYKIFEDIDVIPVVRGGGNYTELAPTDSYINSKDFRSPEELGKYLNELSKNKQKYISMLKVKDK